MPGDQSFNFIGTSEFSGTAAEVRYSVDFRGVVVWGDMDGDGIADLRIDLPDVSSLGADDFIL